MGFLVSNKIERVNLTIIKTLHIGDHPTSNKYAEILPAHNHKTHIIYLLQFWGVKLYCTVYFETCYQIPDDHNHISLFAGPPSVRSDKEGPSCPVVQCPKCKITF